MPMKTEVVDQFWKSENIHDIIGSKILRCEVGKMTFESPLLLTSTRNAKIETAVQKIDIDSSKVNFLSDESPFAAFIIEKRSPYRRHKMLPIATDERNEFSSLFIGLEST